MKAFSIFILGLAECALLASLAAAQDSKPPVPAPPFLVPVPASAHWIITFSRSVLPGSGGTAVPAPLDPGEPSSVETITNGSVMLVTLTIPGQPPVHLDRDGTSYIQRTSDGISLLGGFPNVYVTDGFLFADWVRSEGVAAFQEVVKYQGVLCFHYRNMRPEDRLNNDPNWGEEAWVDVKTMLPVAATKHGLEADFHFQSPPDSALHLPADEAQLIRDRENVVRAFNAMR